MYPILFEVFGRQISTYGIFIIIGALAVAHGFGRIGCFFGDCCYGVEVHNHNPFAVYNLAKAERSVLLTAKW